MRTLEQWATLVMFAGLITGCVAMVWACDRRERDVLFQAEWEQLLHDYRQEQL